MDSEKRNDLDEEEREFSKTPGLENDIYSPSFEEGVDETQAQQTSPSRNRRSVSPLERLPERKKSKKVDFNSAFSKGKF
jgi:hypothetical protein